MQEPSGIKGWLLFFVILSAIGVLKGFSSIIPEWELVREQPVLKYGVMVETLIIVTWNLFYLYSVYLICSIEKNAINIIKKVLIIGPIVNILVPLFTLFVFIITIDGLKIDKEIIISLYDPSTIGSIIGSVISSCIWYKYFSVSIRVHNTWGQKQNY